MAPPKQVVDVESQDSSIQSLDGNRFRKFANPGPLGLSAFALTTLFLSLINVQARSVTVPNLVIGLGSSSICKTYGRICVWRICAIHGGNVGICLRKYIWSSCIYLVRIILDKSRNDICSCVQHCWSIYEFGGVCQCSWNLSHMYLISSHLRN